MIFDDTFRYIVRGRRLRHYETFVKSYMTNNVISIIGYTHTQSSEIITHTEGVVWFGLFIYTSKNSKLKVMLRPSNSNIEYIFIRICHGNQVLVVVIYRPPSAESILTLPEDEIDMVLNY